MSCPVSLLMKNFHLIFWSRHLASHTQCSSMVARAALKCCQTNVGKIPACSLSAKQTAPLKTIEANSCSPDNIKMHSPSSIGNRFTKSVTSKSNFSILAFRPQRSTINGSNVCFWHCPLRPQHDEKKKDATARLRCRHKMHLPINGQSNSSTALIKWSIKTTSKMCYWSETYWNVVKKAAVAFANLLQEVCTLLIYFSKWLLSLHQ